MNKNLILLLIALAFSYVVLVIYDFASRRYDNPEFQVFIEDYRKKVTEAIVSSQEGQAVRMAHVSSSSGTSSNFEGPQVLLKAIKFHNEMLSKEDERLKHFDGVSAIFDPDHSYYGLPDVKISVKDVRLYKPEKGKIAGFLDDIDDDSPKPYKVYTKSLISDSTQGRKFFEMQLWLTEFDVTVDVRPDLDAHKAKKAEEEGIEYPGFWYGLRKERVKLEELDMEFKDQRYGNLAFILEVIPNTAPIYIHTNNVKTTKADFAIGAIYCTKAIIGNEEKVQRINTNIHSGQPVFLNHAFDFEKMNQNLNNYPETIGDNVNRVMNSDAPHNTFIWNKPYYIKLHFTNLGTWRSGLLNQNKYHDQVTYSFLMPVFVVGSWDIIPPQEVLPKWEHPAPYKREFKLKNLVPLWGDGILGRVVNIILVLVICLVVLQLLIPGFGAMMRKMFFK